MKHHPLNQVDTGHRAAGELALLRQLHRAMVRRRDGLIAEARGLQAQLETMQHELVEQARELQASRQVRKELAEVEFRATHDDLTGLPNRAGILDLLSGAQIRAERKGTLVAVLIADLDRFKQVNDTYGHMVGDEVLRNAARRLNDAVRSYDAVGRYGDDYFLIVLAGCESKLDAVAQAERLRWSVSMEPIHVMEWEIPISVSIGGTTASSSCEIDSLIREADKALYRAKRAGGNRVDWS